MFLESAKAASSLSCGCFEIIVKGTALNYPTGCPEAAAFSARFIVSAIIT
jgi:hypothetical protein